MEQQVYTIRKWFNISFDCLKSHKLTSLNNLQDSELTLLILKEIDTFFENLGLSIGSTDKIKINNLNKIYKAIISYYQINEINLEENTQMIMNSVTENTDESFKYLSSLIVGASILSHKKEFYLDKMQTLGKVDRNILFQILTERLTNHASQDNNKEQTSFGDEEDNNIIARFETIENENFELIEKNKVLSKKVEEMTSHCYTLELNYSELENKYNDLLTNQPYKTNNQNDIEVSCQLSIQLSELKGKLNHKEEYISNLIKEKKKIQEENNQKLLELYNENSSLKENLVKFEILKEKTQKFLLKNEECQMLKSKNNKLEILNQELEEKLRRLKVFIECDKNKILKNVEDLSYDLEREKTINMEMKKEIDYFKERILKTESENSSLKKKLETSQNQDNDAKPQNNCNNNSSYTIEEDNKTPRNTLENIEADNDYRKTFLELESRVQILYDENVSLIKIKDDLQETIKLNEEKFKVIYKENSELTEKNEKLKKAKEEIVVLKSKLEDLNNITHNLEQKRVEIDSLKLDHFQTLTNLEKTFNNTINQIKNENQNELYKLQEKINLLTIELNLKEKENKRLEEVLQTNKILLSQNQSNSSMNENIKLIESLKEISREEILTLKTKLHEKDIIIEELNKRIEEKDNESINYENLHNSQQEMKIKDEIINKYKSSLEERNNYFEEQSRFFSKLFYELSVNILVQKYSLYNDEGFENNSFNWKID